MSGFDISESLLSWITCKCVILEHCCSNSKKKIIINTCLFAKFDFTFPACIYNTVLNHLLNGLILIDNIIIPIIFKYTHIFIRIPFYITQVYSHIIYIYTIYTFILWTMTYLSIWTIIVWSMWFLLIFKFNYKSTK